jgi:DnaJ like chaperone protein
LLPYRACTEGAASCRPQGNRVKREQGVNWTGKIIGGTLGFAALGPWGGLLGAWVGHQFDRGAGLGGVLGRSPDPIAVNAVFFPTTFRVMGNIAKADGRVSEQEIASARAIMQALRLNPAQRLAAMGYFNEGKQPDFDLDTAVQRLGVLLAPYPELVNFFLEIQLQAAIAGDGLSAMPRARLQRVAASLRVTPAQFARLESILRWRHGAGSAGSGPGADALDAERLAQAYSLLEAEPAMSDEAVVKAYRRQMSRHHPDKLQANGLPESMLERAKERTQQIQAAYELIRARRGMR